MSHAHPEGTVRRQSVQRLGGDDTNARANGVRAAQISGELPVHSILTGMHGQDLGPELANGESPCLVEELAAWTVEARKVLQRADELLAGG